MSNTASSESPSRQLAGFIAKFDPAVGKVIRSARATLRRRLPTANELVYDNYNFLAIGYCATERASDCIVSLAAASNGVGLSFYYGAGLPDPKGILLGGGNQNRFVRLPSAATLDEPAVAALINAAIARAKTPLAKSGKGSTIIKSISKKQRPRRVDPVKPAQASPRSGKPKPAASSARSAKGSSRSDPAVDAFMAALKHPLKTELESLRRLILGVSPAIEEGIKWNSPSFRTADWFATINLHGTGRLRLILHAGAKVKASAAKGLKIADPSGLLKWLAKDRCLVTLEGGKGFASSKAALKPIIRAWIGQLQ